MEVVVKRSPSTVVRPAEPEPAAATNGGGGTIKLSSFDRVCAMTPITALLVFEHPIREAAETLKGALSRALVPYYLSGTRRRDDADHVAGELTANTKLTRTQRTRSCFGAVKLGSFSMVYCYAYITDYKETNLALSIRPSTIRTF